MLPMNDSRPMEDYPAWVKKMLQDRPWEAPQEWYRYRCLSCSHTHWVEDIIVDAFPPVEPGGCPELICPACGGRFLRDPSVAQIASYTQPQE
jgi:predicted nucleic acid-binding Zn ribbon protein